MSKTNCTAIYLIVVETFQSAPKGWKDLKTNIANPSAILLVWQNKHQDFYTLILTMMYHRFSQKCEFVLEVRP